MNKSILRSSIIRLRKKNYDEHLKINSKKFILFFKKNKIQSKNIGGYHASE